MPHPRKGRSRQKYAPRVAVEDVPELNEQVAAAGRMWGGADYDRMAQQFAPIHDDLVARVAPAVGERWLDVGTGTGEVALRAARSGADVTAVDISDALLDIARAKAGAASVTWELGDAQSLRFDDASFEGVVSCFAVIFAPNPEAAAGELARVCRPGGRLGVTAWRPEDAPHAIYQRFAPNESYATADEWGKESRVTELLGKAFELQIEEGVWHLTGESPEAVWELVSEGAPPLKALLGNLGPDQAAEFREAMLDYWTGFQTNGGVDEPRRFLIVTGRRR
jgi:ubiquinone/menaquinone biosynthesis C-methylase UbiE